MCINCWNNNGSPANWSEDIARALELARELYAIHPAGGPLHVELDDWNIDGTITPRYDGWPDEKLDELYDDGWRLADLDPQAPVAVEGRGRSVRQICDELAALLNSMPVEDRLSALAYHDGYATPPERMEP